MWGEFCNYDIFEEKEIKIQEQFELEEKMDRIAHPLKHKIMDAKDKFALWLLKL